MGSTRIGVNARLSRPSERTEASISLTRLIRREAAAQGYQRRTVCEELGLAGDAGGGSPHNRPTSPAVYSPPPVATNAMFPSGETT